VLYVKNFHGNNVKFVYYELLALDLAKYRAGVGVPTLNRNTFKDVLVAVPPHQEQEEMVRALDCVQNKITNCENRHEALDALFQTLLHHLMTGKVRVHDAAAVGPPR
jgi:type I restriction enzyme S subunit